MYRDLPRLQPLLLPRRLVQTTPPWQLRRRAWTHRPKATNRRDVRHRHRQQPPPQPHNHLVDHRPPQQPCRRADRQLRRRRRRRVRRCRPQRRYVSLRRIAKAIRSPRPRRQQDGDTTPGKGSKNVNRMLAENNVTQKTFYKWLYNDYSVWSWD